MLDTIARPADAPVSQAGRLQRLRAQLVDVPEDATRWTELGLACAQAGAVAEGIAALHRGLELQPGQVLAQAYLGALLHLDGRHAEALEVLDYDGLVSAGPLQPQADPSVVQAFNRELLDHVRSHPSLRWELEGKSTRLGWQTEELLGDAAPVIARLHQLLRAHLQDLLGPDDEDPQDGVAPSQWRLTAWGVALERGGHQLPHVHQAGIVSGVYYVQVPELVGSIDAGCLRFARRLPWLPGVGHATPPGRIVRPRAGDVVVFPSHFWHETVPFDAATQRVSIAFDVQPAPQAANAHAA